MSKTNIYKYYYNWKIGIYNFNIYTLNSKLDMPFHYLKGKEDIQITINILLNENEIEKKNMLLFCKKNCQNYVPEELEIFYKNINNILR